MQHKVKEWTQDIMNLSNIASSQPHAAYTAYIHGLSSRWSYLMRTVPDIADLLQPLEDAIHQHYIPSLTGRPPCSSVERDLLALPTRLGGLGLSNPTTIASDNFTSLEHITAPLIALIISQNTTATIDQSTTNMIKSQVITRNLKKQDEQAHTVYNQLGPDQKCCIDLSKEIGSWLCAIPFEEHGFHLHKGEFRDALSLCYGWKLNNVPRSCNCGAPFTVNHAMTCHMGGFPTLRHNEIRDITASLLTEVCNNVATEPTLRPLNDEIIASCSANTDNGACADIRARGFGTDCRMHFLTLGYFTQTHPQTAPTTLRQFTGNMSKLRSVNMENGSEKWSVGCLLLLFCRRVVPWEKKQPHSTGD